MAMPIGRQMSIKKRISGPARRLELGLRVLHSIMLPSCSHHLPCCNFEPALRQLFLSMSSFHPCHVQEHHLRLSAATVRTPTSSPGGMPHRSWGQKQRSPRMPGPLPAFSPSNIFSCTKAVLETVCTPATNSSKEHRP
ncbi:Hypothetical predicted protein [Pelobates cultripes]|uniref:Uncharacterized protein n=1 Tax=Pelobates cultripes TaxID=61616 RepID=A0AAD1SA50_PELCU|nr:Hypothetical predicted protein [Pelobates cultripes]